MHFTVNHIQSDFQASYRFTVQASFEVLTILLYDDWKELSKEAMPFLLPYRLKLRHVLDDFTVALFVIV